MHFRTVLRMFIIFCCQLSEILILKYLTLKLLFSVFRCCCWLGFLFVCQLTLANSVFAPLSLDLESPDCEPWLFLAWPLSAFIEDRFCCWYQLGTYGISQVVKTAFSVPYDQISARPNATFSKYNLLNKKILAKNKRTGEERKSHTYELNVWDRWRSLNLLQNRTWAQGAPGGQNAYSLRPSKLTRKDASQEIWELVRKWLAYSWMKNVVQYISVYSAAKSYSSVNLFRNTRRRSSAKSNGILYICPRHMLMYSHHQRSLVKENKGDCYPYSNSGLSMPLWKSGHPKSGDAQLVCLEMLYLWSFWSFLKIQIVFKVSKIY